MELATNSTNFHKLMNETIYLKFIFICKLFPDLLLSIRAIGGNMNSAALVSIYVIIGCSNSNTLVSIREIGGKEI